MLTSYDCVYILIFIFFIFRGGYKVVPLSIEFWQGQSDRLHDRIRFRRADSSGAQPDGKKTFQGQDGWVYERLAP